MNSLAHFDKWKWSLPNIGVDKFRSWRFRTNVGFFPVFWGYFWTFFVLTFPGNVLICREHLPENTQVYIHEAHSIPKGMPLKMQKMSLSTQQRIQLSQTASASVVLWTGDESVHGPKFVSPKWWSNSSETKRNGGFLCNVQNSGIDYCDKSSVNFKYFLSQLQQQLPNHDRFFPPQIEGGGKVWAQRKQRKQSCEQVCGFGSFQIQLRAFQWGPRQVVNPSCPPSIAADLCKFCDFSTTCFELFVSGIMGGTFCTPQAIHVYILFVKLQPCKEHVMSVTLNIMCVCGQSVFATDLKERSIGCSRSAIQYQLSRCIVVLWQSQNSDMGDLWKVFLFFFFVSQFVCPQCVSTSVVVAMFCNQRNLEILSNVKMQRNDVSFSFWNVNHSESSNVLFGSDCLEKVLKWWFACCCPFPKLCSFSSTFQRMYKKKKPRRRGEDLQKSMFSCKRKGPAECFEFLFVQLLKLLHKRANKYRVSLEKCVEIYWKKKKMWWKRWYKTKPLDVEIWRPLWTLNISK